MYESNGGGGGEGEGFSLVICDSVYLPFVNPLYWFVFDG